MQQQRRRRTELFVLPNRPCGLCGDADAIVTESRELRQGLAWMNPFWSPSVEVYELCGGCGARRPVESGLSA
ncbi:MAG TPA: hypothetical protein VGD12_18320 [Blastococcus sp.]